MDKLKLNTSFKWVLQRKNFFSKDECIEMKKFIDVLEFNHNRQSALARKKKYDAAHNG